MSTRARDFVENYNCFFITTTFNDWLPLFINEFYYQIVIDSICYCLKKFNADLISYVLMPNHIHLILFFNEKCDLSGFMRDLKKFTSSKIRQQLTFDCKFAELLEIKYEKNGQKFKVWKDRFDAVVIRHKNVLFTKMKYIHENPVKKGFVLREEDWKYSSAAFYKFEREYLVPIKHAGSIV